MKKVLAFLLTVCLAAGLLSGCGGSGSDKPDTPAGPGASSEPGDPSASGETWKMVMEIINYGFNDPDLEKVQDEVNKITVPKIGVEVEFLPVPIMNMGTKLGMMVSGNEKIDLTVAGLLTTPSKLVSDGLLQPITEYVNNSEALTSLAEGILDACVIDGEVYAYPGSTANGVQVTFFYDKDLADQYNIKLPDRLDSAEKWEDLLAQVKASGMSQYGISLGDGMACEYEWTAMDTLGDDANASLGVVLDKDADANTVVNYFATEEYKNKCLMHRDWWEKGYAVPDSNSNGYSTTDSMTQGMIFGFVSQGGVSMSDAYFSKITGKNIASIPMTDVTTKSGNVVNFSWAVPTSCEHPEKVVQFLELLYTDTELANLMNYGIEGVHYVTTEGSQIIGYPEGVDPQSCGYGSFIGTYGDISKTYQREPMTDEFIATIPDYMVPKAPVSKYMGYSFNQTKVSTELAAVNAVIGQYAPALECGIVDPEQVLPEFLSALETAGIDAVIAENQAQLNDWLASK